MLCAEYNDYCVVVCTYYLYTIPKLIRFQLNIIYGLWMPGPNKCRIFISKSNYNIGNITGYYLIEFVIILYSGIDEIRKQRSELNNDFVYYSRLRILQNDSVIEEHHTYIRLFKFVTSNFKKHLLIRVILVTHFN